MYIEGDVPVVTTGGNGNNGNGLMNGDGIWAIILFALIFGRNGYGGFCGFGGGGGGVGENYILATDFATIERKLDSISNGICDATFALNNNLTQGFAGLNTALLTQGYETRFGTQALAGQLAQCCCDLKQGIGEVNYNIATQFGGLNATLCGLSRDIIDNQNANYRALHDEIVANKIEAKNDKIAELTLMLNKADLRASQEAQNAYLISQLGQKCPQPAYVVQPPQNVTFPTNCCGQVNYAGYSNSGCGCC